MRWKKLFPNNIKKICGADDQFYPKKEEEFQKKTRDLSKQLLEQEEDFQKKLIEEKKILQQKLEEDIRKTIHQDFENRITILQRPTRINRKN